MPLIDPQARRDYQRGWARRRRASGVIPGSAVHGRCATYNYGCRCDACVQANRARVRAQQSTRDRVKQAWAEGRGHELRIPHGITGYGSYDCRCQVCGDANTDAWQAKQDDTRATAVNHGYPWTDDEYAVAGRADLTTMEVALMLGRTYASTKSARCRLHRRGKPRAAGAAKKTTTPRERGRQAGSVPPAGSALTVAGPTPDPQSQYADGTEAP